MLSADQPTPSTVSESESAIDLKEQFTKMVNHFMAYEKKLELKLASLKQMLQDLTQSSNLILINAQSSAATALDEADRKREESLQVTLHDVKQGLKEIQDDVKEIKRITAELVNNQL
ncbi:hypothetical protein D5018_00700 [Parashewanella curva]|uniref:Uncharacterized protein n=2 Tax=Parashewanella curva TaxID=2338552 RepID=A0A3L8Q2C6_9GAMM|nr:hypothetical protein D5018_00700 [Parashewanella curva]